MERNVNIWRVWKTSIIQSALNNNGSASEHIILTFSGDGCAKNVKMWENHGNKPAFCFDQLYFCNNLLQPFLT